jgi:hypothetical protein
MPARPFFLKPLPLGTITTGNERSERPASHLGELDAIGMVWRSNGTSNLWVRGDLGSAKAIDFISVIHANALSGTTIRVRLGDNQAAVDGSSASYDSEALPFISPSATRADGLYSSHLELPSAETRRWWRIDIGGHSGDFEAATLVLGKRITPSRYYSAGFEFGVKDLGSSELTRWGIPDQAPGLIFRTLRFKLGWIEDAEYENEIRLFDEAVGRRQVVFACFDPIESIYRQNKSYLGWLNDDPFAVGGVNKPGTYSHDYSIISMI